MRGSSCEARDRLGSRSRSPWSIDRKSSRGNAALGLSITRSRSGSRSGLGSRSSCRRIQGELSGRSGDGGGCADNEDNINIWDDDKDVDDRK